MQTLFDKHRQIVNFVDITKNRPQHLAFIALVIWFCSLIPTSITLYSEESGLTGFYILIAGWLSPLVLNFAWFANIFFLYSVIRLITGGTATIAPILAALLSLDTFRFSEFLLNEGGATTPVYGYGWGGGIVVFIYFYIVNSSWLYNKKQRVSR